jgi:bcr-type benzoyl-CoA reductase subunit D
MSLSIGIDAGSSAIKVAVVQQTGGSGHEATHAVLGAGQRRIRGRGFGEVLDAAMGEALEKAGVRRDEISYIATTGEAEGVEFRTGHFYSMTTHARGALFLDADSRAAMDIGALHGRVIKMDERGKVLGYRMTNQCASGSGQFLENISRYLGVTRDELGKLSMSGETPEKVSGICAVLAETDVINMVSRGISTANILKGIHISMGTRCLKLVKSAKATGVIMVTGGLAHDEGLIAAMEEISEEKKFGFDLRVHPDSVYAGAIGAGIWGLFRNEKLMERGGLATA